MAIPHENALAFFPADVSAGNITLRPLTLAGAVRLAEAGVEVGQRVPADKVFAAAWVLSDGAETFPQFCKRAKSGFSELSNAIEQVLNNAYETFVKPAANRSGDAPRSPHGLGWPLEYAEWMCAEYGWSWSDAINTPLATVHALYAACRQRNGGKSGMDYFERAYAKTLRGK